MPVNQYTDSIVEFNYQIITLYISCRTEKDILMPTYANKGETKLPKHINVKRFSNNINKIDSFLNFKETHLLHC